MESFNNHILDLLRKARLKTQKQLADECDLTQGHLSKIINGVNSPTEEQIKKFSEVLQYPEAIFFEPGKGYGAPISIHSMFRKKQSTAQKEVDMLEAEMELRLRQLRKLLKAVEVTPPSFLPYYDIEDYEGDAREVARHVRQAWGIPRGPIDNLMEYVEAAGCVVFLCDFGAAKIDGVSLRPTGLPPCIFLNESQPADRMRFTLAHELGHLVMHKTHNPEMEDQANAFAAALLVPRSDIDFGRRITLSTLAHFKPIWKVSMAMLLVQAKVYNCITKSQSDYLWRQMSASGYRSQEPRELDFSAERPAFINDLIELHREQLEYSDEELSEKVLMINKDEFFKKYHLQDNSNKEPILRVIK